MRFFIFLIFLSAHVFSCSELVEATEDVAPLSELSISPAADELGLSVSKILAKSIGDECIIGDYILHGVDALRGFMDTIQEPHKTLVQTLKPCVVFDAEEVHQIVTAFAFLPEAFGKTGEPLYIYGLRKKTEDEIFKEQDTLARLKIFDDEKNKLGEKFSEISKLCTPEIHSFRDKEVSYLAVELLKFFADYGIAQAQHNYGELLFSGAGCEMDPVMGVYYIKLAAENGLSMAQYRYAQMLEHGNGVHKNIFKAIRFREPNLKFA